LQQNVDRIKEENDMDVLSEEDSIGVKRDEVYIPSAFPTKSVEPKASLII
jgi:hypothetical protein